MWSCKCTLSVPNTSHSAAQAYMAVFADPTFFTARFQGEQEAPPCILEDSRRWPVGDQVMASRPDAAARLRPTHWILRIFICGAYFL
mmetsp:Transcript_79978/g.161846  ORF Transcript_79978/g.161846 Transcript_79978/m.161846 type:complete len:87 (+) Transcript_79978:217-477(+)